MGGWNSKCAKPWATIIGAFVGGHLTVHRDMITNITNTTSAPSARTGDFRSNMPFPTLLFQGREDILGKIKEHFNGVPAGSTDCFRRMVTIAGMGGIGKSETACKFAMEHSQIYTCAAWINAETEQTTLDSFLSLAKQLKIVSQDRKETDLDLVRSVYGHIDEYYCHRKVLLIFDNAIQLHSRGNEFGIFDYLPTQVLSNKSFPFVIITSQTTDWQPGITTFELDELKVMPSVSFFRSTFKISSDECDENFMELHSHLQGYPLAMTLAASNIDFDPEKDTVNWLKNKIKEYVENFKNEDSRILTEEIHQNWPSKYEKTLATVWKLSLQRLEAAPNGPNALVVLKAVSFFHVPLTQDDLRCVFIECPYCPGTSDWMKNPSLIESIRLLRKFHLVDAVFQNWDYSNELNALQTNAEISPEDLPRVQTQVKDAQPFKCELRIHRLVQLVVRLDTDCSVVLEDILRYLAFWTNTHVRQLNTPAVEEALGRSTLSTRALAFVELLALKGNITAQRIVPIPRPPLDPAKTIWDALQLDQNIRTLNEDAIEVLRRFVGLSKTEQSLIDKRCFAQRAMEMFYPKIILSYAPGNEASAQGLELQNFSEIQDIACELLTTGCSLTDVCDIPELCVNTERSNAATYTVFMGKKIIQDLTDANKPESEIAPIKDQLLTYCDKVKLDSWLQYREELEEIFSSYNSWNNFLSEVESCGRDELGLKQVLISTYFDQIWTATGNKDFNYSTRLCYFFRELDRLMYGCLGRWRLREELIPLMKSFIESVEKRVPLQQSAVLETLEGGFLSRWRPRETLIPLMESFMGILVKRDKEQSSVSKTLKENEVFVAVWICSTWVNFCLQESLSSTDLSTCFSQVRILTAIKNTPTDRIPDLLKCFNDWELLRTRHKESYDEFLKIHSKSTGEGIGALVPFCTNIQNKINLYRN